LSLKHTYTLIAPFYDAAIGRLTQAARKRSLSALPEKPGRVLLAGVGTGLDLPHLPLQHHYVGLDLNRAMLRRALPALANSIFCRFRVTPSACLLPITASIVRYCI
jgi:phosphatidylethanolamine/phosphatidyl-N-methylethanolamine N-methyltransferase